MTNKQKIVRFFDLVLVLLVIFAVVNHIEDLVKERTNLKLIILHHEMQLLNNVRIYEYNKNLNYLDLLECRGENKQSLDSIRVLLDSTNYYIKMRDDSYINGQVEQIKHDEGI